MNYTTQQQILLPKGVTIRDPAGGHYEVVGLLGRGEIGSVYLVRDRRFKRSLFALKEVIDPDKRGRERFLFEGEVLERLRHWALPRVYRVFEQQKLKRVYILMDYVQGKNLETLLREQPHGRFSLPLVLTLMAPIADALIYLHRQDPPIVHRDIKPANIIVPINADEAMLVDFGSAKEYVADMTTAINHRSPGYAAPEQYSGGTTPRTDIYGLGATFYTLLTGMVPVDAISRITHRKGDDPLKPANLLEPSIPPAVAQALQRALSISGADRFGSVEEFWQELHAYTTWQSVHLPRVTSADTPQPLPDAPRTRKLETFISHFIYMTLFVALVLGRGFFPALWWYTALLLYCGGLLLALVLSLRRR